MPIDHIIERYVTQGLENDWTCLVRLGTVVHREEESHKLELCLIVS